MVFDNTKIFGEKMGNAKIRAAVDYLDWLITGDPHAVHLDQGRFSPLIGDAVSDPKPAFLYAVGVMKELDLFDMGYGSQWGDMVGEKYKAALDNIFAGQDVKEALADFQEEVNSEIVY